MVCNFSDPADGQMNAIALNQYNLLQQFQYSFEWLASPIHKKSYKDCNFVKSSEKPRILDDVAYRQKSNWAIR